MLAPAVLTPATAAPLPPAITEVNPDTVTPTSDLKYGGRIESLAINPVNPQIVLGAGELGGLWRSTDGADTWKHVDAMPLTRMYDVAFAASDPDLVIATGDNDGAAPSRGGIWRSTDGGATWSRPASAMSTACGGTPGAHWVDIAGTTPGSLTVVAATDCGISVSTDSGATWNTRFPAGGGSARFWDAKARQVGGNIQVDVCGDGGFTRSTNGGTTFSAFVGDSSSLGGPVAAPPCRIAVAPNDANTVFISSFKRGTTAPACSSALQVSYDANTAAPTWTDLNACPNGNRNGRWPFVVVQADNANPSTSYQVYFGDNTRTQIQTCTYAGTPQCATGPWSMYDGNHPHNGTDPTDVAFDPTIPNGCPVLVAGDGGVAAPSDCSTNPGSWTMKNTGLNALQALNIAGSVYAGHTSVYFGTQDDGIFHSADDGSTYGRDAYDIYGLFADHVGSGTANVLWRQCCFGGTPANLINLSNETLSSNAGWSAAPPLPPGNNPNDNFTATQFGKDRYAFITPDIAPVAPPAPQPNYQTYVSTNDGGAWTQMGGNAPGAPTGLMWSSGTTANPVFYAMFTVGGNNRIYRLAGPMNNTAVYTDVTGNLQAPTTFAVHPTNPLLLYANDANLNQVMKSTNGGASWTADTNLTTLATRGGTFPFANGGSQISAFAFDGNSNTVMAGANNSGIFASTNGGASWFSVRGAENLPRIAGFFFDERTHRIYTASGGRGMWRIDLPAADLRITKTASPEPVTAGKQLTYTLKVTNDSASPATAGSVVVTDDLPTQTTYLTSSTTCVEAPPGRLSCGVPDLAPGDSFTFTITVLVHSDAVLGTGGATTITNTATVSSADSRDDDTSDNTATATSTVVDSADLQVTKLCKPDTTIYAGTPIACTIYVDNRGPSDARNVVVDDVVLSNGTFTIASATASPSAGPCTISAVTGGQKLTCPIGNLAAASTTSTGRATITYQVTDANEGQDINNVASVRSDTPDPDNTNNQATVNLTVTSLADLSITKSGPGSVSAGSAISWTLSVHNNGPSRATNVKITDTVPAGVAITSVSMPGATCVAGTAGDPLAPTVCNVGTLNAGATSATMTINAVVDPGTTGVLHNDARVSSATFDDKGGNDLAHSDTTVNVVADVGVAITATPNPVTAGTALSYRLTVSNNGPSTATGVTLEYPLNPGVTFTSTGGVGTCGYQTNTHVVSCQLPDLAPGANEVVFVYTLVKPSTPIGPITATASVDANGTDPVPGNDTGSVSTPVQTRADLGIVLVSDLLVYKPSTVIHYDITVTNYGPSDAQDVHIKQFLPDAKTGTYVSNNLPGCPPPSGTTLECVVPTLVAGGIVHFQVNFFIQGNKKTITSNATVSTATTDPVSSNNNSIRVVTVK